MAGTVIDSLLITLGLDSSKFASGANDANQRLEKFRKTVASLGVDESKLDDKQKRGLSSLEKVATQSQRTRKELSAAAGAGSDFWGILKSGALGFGAALGAVALKQFVVDTTNSVAATGRLAKNLGSSTDAVTKWGRAVAQSVGGDIGSVMSGLTAFHQNLLGARLGQNPAMFQTLSMIGMLSGKPVNLRGSDGKWLSDEDVKLQLADAAQRMGPEKASLFLPQLGIGADETNFLEKGRAGVLAALAQQDTVGAPTDKDSHALSDLQNAEKQLSTVIEQVQTNFLLLAAPDLTLGIKNFSAALLNGIAWFHHMRHDTTDEQYKAKVHANNLAVYGVDEADEDDARAAANSAHIPLSGQDNPGWFRRQLRKVGVDIRVGDFDPAVIPRIKQLTRAGLTADEAARLVKLEVLSGHVPRVPELGEADISGLPAGMLDAIPKLERSGDHAVSPAGAAGRYQLMPATAAHYGVDPMDPEQSKRAAGSLLLELYKHYNGDALKTIAGYNWKRSLLDKDIAQHGAAWRDFLPPETSSYVFRYGQLMSGGGSQGKAEATSTIVNTGAITVNTQAKDGHEVANALRKEFAARATVAQSTSGIAN